MGEIMSGFSWLLVDLLSALLEPDERNAVLGDLTESRASGSRALWDVLGLVCRRQLTLWAGFRPWLAVVAIILPLGMLLSHVSRWFADTTVLYTSHYWVLWDFAYLGYPGWR